MKPKNLEEAIQAAGNAVDMLRNSQAGPNAYPGVPAEYTNWRDEQEAWQKTCVLYNQSYHMADLAVEGPDALKLLSHLGVNSFKSFQVDKAKQFVPCSHDGYVIGDVILFYLGENQFNLVGRAPTLNWLQYHADTGDYDVKVELDQRTALRDDPSRRKSYRFQVQGPNAMDTINKALGQPAPDLKFFNMTMVTIAGKQVRALRHGMAGQPGFEFFGPWDDGEAVRNALINAGEEFGMRLVGSRSYSSNTLESGWIPSPLPAVYSGESMKAYRQWLPATGYEASASIGGSFYSDNIDDYYFTPWDLGYGHIVKFDHDFIGREALEKLAEAPTRRKVTLALDNDDTLRSIGTQLFEADRAKYMDFPSAVYSMHPFDKVLVDGKIIGVSTWIGYSSNERKMLTLAVLDVDYAEPGTEVTFVWGEEGGGSSKPTVESHTQAAIRAVVCPVPYAEVARKSYAGEESWRADKA
ncbi:MAG: aminomethyltransferase family protein [Woeseiaceae bacterium]